MSRAAIPYGSVEFGRPGGDKDDGIVEDAAGDPTLTLYNEGGYNSTSVRIADVLAWVTEHRPDLLRKAGVR